MRMHPAISGAYRHVTTTPPWYVRVFGVALLSADVWWWHADHGVTMLEFAKHGLLLAIGLACFFPEGLVMVTNTARRLPFFDRRAGPRPPKAG